MPKINMIGIGCILLCAVLLIGRYGCMSMKELNSDRDLLRVITIYNNAGLAVENIEGLTKLIAPINRYLKKYFPKGEIDFYDMITLAYMESQYDQFAIGSHKEVGYFQILDWRGALKDIHKDNMNPFDPYVNVEMSLFVLRDKIIWQKGDIKMGVQCYNGLYSTDYLAKFIKIRKIFPANKYRSKTNQMILVSAK